MKQHRVGGATNGTTPTRKLLKSRSQGDSLDDGSIQLVLAPQGSGDGYRRSPRVHLYEEIRPKLVYADIDHINRGRQGRAGHANPTYTSPTP